MRIIGIDPGSRFTGYGIVDKQAGRLVHIECGVIVPPAKAPLADRLFFIARELDAVLAQFRPESAGVEDVFFAKNWKSALALGQARGAALSSLGRAGLAVTAYAPTLVKQSVVGYGRAEKDQVQQMVRLLLGLPEIPEQNAADALAIAICHCNEANNRFKDMLK